MVFVIFFKYYKEIKYLYYFEAIFVCFKVTSPPPSPSFLTETNIKKENSKEILKRSKMILKYLPYQNHILFPLKFSLCFFNWCRKFFKYQEYIVNILYSYSKSKDLSSKLYRKNPQVCAINWYFKFFSSVIKKPKTIIFG